MKKTLPSIHLDFSFIVSYLSYKFFPHKASTSLIAVMNRRSIGSQYPLSMVILSLGTAVLKCEPVLAGM
jgi:hypothetical protein